MMRSHVDERHQSLAELALRVGQHRLHDVAAEVRDPAGGAARSRRRRRRTRSTWSVRRLDLVALEEVLALLVAGEVEDRLPRARSALRDREQHGVAEAAAARAAPSRRSGISVGVPVGPITTTGSPGSQRRAQARASRPSRARSATAGPCSLSTHAPVSARPSIGRRRAVDDARDSDSKFCRR